MSPAPKEFHTLFSKRIIQYQDPTAVRREIRAAPINRDVMLTPWMMFAGGLLQLGSLAATAPPTISNRLGGCIFHDIVLHSGHEWRSKRDELSNGFDHDSLEANQFGQHTATRADANVYCSGTSQPPAHLRRGTRQCRVLLYESSSQRSL